MSFEKYNFGADADLMHCQICKQSFTEGEKVSVISSSHGPFLLVHKQCYAMLKKNANDREQVDHCSPSDIQLSQGSRLWRYMDLAKFISILKSNSLYFSSPKYFLDIYEGAHGLLSNKSIWDSFYTSFAKTSIITAPDNCWHYIEPDKLEADARRLLEHISIRKDSGIFICCWHQNEFESEAMWKMYSSSVNNAIAIQTTYGALQNELGCNITVKPVQYVDFSRQFAGPNDVFWCKRKAFEYEREVRAVFHDDCNPSSAGKEVKVNLDKLINSVYVSPYAPEWFHEVVTDLIPRYGCSFSVHPSEMTEASF